MGDSVLPYADLQTILFQIANRLNDRPIGMKPGYDLELGQYLCPNDLLLGRSTINPISGTHDASFNPEKRFKHLTAVIDSFWKRWERDYFHTLLIRQKWHVQSRNLTVGDIVMVKDKNVLRGNWRLARVHEVHPGADGKVRNVTLSYKMLEPGSNYSGGKSTYIKRSVHNLVVILPIDEQ